MKKDREDKSLRNVNGLFSYKEGSEICYFVNTSAPSSVISTMYSICADNPSSIV